MIHACSDPESDAQLAVRMPVRFWANDSIRRYDFYYLAWMYALDSQKKKALDFLRLAVECGFNDITAIEENHDFEGIRNSPEFREILNILKEIT